MSGLSSTHLGILCMLISMFFVSVNDMVIKSLSGEYPLHQLIALRSALGIPFSFALLMLEGGPRLLRTGMPGLHILRGLLIVIGNSCLYAGLVAMPLATANAIYFVAPLFVTLLSIPVLGEQVAKHRFGAVACGFGGVLLMMGPELLAGEAGLGWIVLLPVIAAAAYAGMSVLTRKLGATSRASALSMQIQFAFLSVSGLMYLIAGDGRFVDETSNPSLQFLLRAWIWPDVADAWPIMVLGLISGLVGYLITQAYRLSSASVVAPFEYVLLIYALFWGWTVFGEWPKPAVFGGATIVIASGIYVFLREARLKS